LVFFFRISPGFEEAFLLSNSAPYFVNPNTLDGLLTFARNNWTDPDKGGGLFVNANVGATFLGVLSITCALFAFSCKRYGFYIVAATLWVAVFFAGSRAASALATVVPLGAYAILASRKQLSKPLALSLMAGHVVLSAGMLILASHSFSMAMDSTATKALSTFGADSAISERIPIWHIAGAAVSEHPLRGLGFGGWISYFKQYPGTDSYRLPMPPHNTILDLWSKGGMPAALLGVAFIVSVLWLVWGAVVRSSARESLALYLATGSVYLWMFAHGMVTNFGLLGEEHALPLAATLLGASLSASDRERRLMRRSQAENVAC
jgi:O-antigen ligase